MRPVAFVVWLFTCGRGRHKYEREIVDGKAGAFVVIPHCARCKHVDVAGIHVEAWNRSIRRQTGRETKRAVRRSFKPRR